MESNSLDESPSFTTTLKTQHKVLRQGDEVEYLQLVE